MEFKAEARLNKIRLDKWRMLNVISPLTTLHKTTDKADKLGRTHFCRGKPAQALILTQPAENGIKNPDKRFWRQERWSLDQCRLSENSRRPLNTDHIFMIATCPLPEAIWVTSLTSPWISQRRYREGTGGCRMEEMETRKNEREGGENDKRISKRERREI